MAIQCLTTRLLIKVQKLDHENGFLYTVDTLTHLLNGGYNMNLTIDLTATEEAQISTAAKNAGIAPAELVRQLVKEHLPIIPAEHESDIDATLQKWQRQDQSTSNANDATQALFARWAEEDAHMTDGEREENDRIYAEIEKNGIPRVQI